MAQVWGMVGGGGNSLAEGVFFGSPRPLKGKLVAVGRGVGRILRRGPGLEKTGQDPCNRTAKLGEA